MIGLRRTPLAQAPVQLFVLSVIPDAVIEDPAMVTRPVGVL
jgi:hypothetical protein